MTDNTKFFGINRGGAQVVDSSPIVGQFEQFMAQKKAQRASELKELTDEQARLKPDGLRNDADRKLFFNGVDEWRNKYVESLNENDPYKKSLLRSQAEQKYLDLHSLVDESKQLAKGESQAGNNFMNPSIRERYPEDVIKKYQASKLLSVRDPNVIKDFSTLKPEVDHDKAMKALQEIDEKGAKEGQWDDGQTRQWTDKFGNLHIQTKHTQTFDPTDRKAKIGVAFDTNERGVRYMMMDVYKDIWDNPDMSFDQKKDASIQRYMDLTGAQQNHHYPDEKVIRPDRFADHWQYQLKYPKSGVEAGAMSPRQILITDMQNGVPGTGEKLLSLTPNGQYGKFKNIGKIGSDKPIIGIDKNNGDHIFTFPPQVDQKVKEQNDALRAKYAKLYPGYKYDEKIPGFKLGKEEKMGEKQYHINPSSPDYASRVAEMASEQNINLSKLDQIEAKKGTRGQIEQVKMPGTGTKPQKDSYTIKGRSYKAESVMKAAKASGMTVEEYIKALGE